MRERQRPRSTDLTITTAHDALVCWGMALTIRHDSYEPRGYERCSPRHGLSDDAQLRAFIENTPGFGHVEGLLRAVYSRGVCRCLIVGKPSRRLERFEEALQRRIGRGWQPRVWEPECEADDVRVNEPIGSLTW